MAANFIFTITREGDQFFAQATGQPKAEIFPQGGRGLFYKVVDAQIIFETDGSGQAVGLTLQRGGANMPARRIR